MSLVGAKGDSNAAKVGGSIDAQDGDIATLGYTKMPFPGEQPAEANSDVSTTKNFAFSSVNQGTSRGAYSQQPDKVNAETGK